MMVCCSVGGAAPLRRAVFLTLREPACLANTLPAEPSWSAAAPAEASGIEAASGGGGTAGMGGGGACLIHLRAVESGRWVWVSIWVSMWVSMWVST